MISDNAKKNIGRIKVLMDRQRNYLAWINFFMIAYLFFEKTGFRWYYLLILPFMLIWAWVDATYILPNETEYIHNKSPMLKEILRESKK